MAHRSLLQRHVALPDDHGSWTFLLGPLLIGLFAGGRPQVATGLLVVAAICGFLMRQPVTMAVKVWSGRRPSSLLPAAWFWIGVYGLVAAVAVAALVFRGFGYLVSLAVPVVPVFAWYLFLVSRRNERRQRLLEVLAAGAMALAAPAVMWIGLGHADVLGWLLWLMVWGQLTSAILLVYLRLEHRRRKRIPELRQRLVLGAPALVFASAVVLFVLIAGARGLAAPVLAAAFGVQWFEVVWWVLRPDTKARPREIGLRQLAVSVVFTATFVVLWNMTR